MANINMCHYTQCLEQHAFISLMNLKSPIEMRTSGLILILLFMSSALSVGAQCSDILDFGVGFSSCFLVSQMGMCGGGWGLSGSCPATCGNCKCWSSTEVGESVVNGLHELASRGWGFTQPRDCSFAEPCNILDSMFG